MSNDILTELRQRGAAIERQGETNWIYDDAADEIEQLRAEIARLRLTDVEWVVFGKVLRRLRESMWSDSSIELVQMASVIDGFLDRHKGGGR